MKKRIGLINKSIVMFFLLGGSMIYHADNSYAADYVLYGKKLNGGIGNYGKSPRSYWMSGYFNTNAKKKPVTDAMYKWNYSNNTGAWTPLMLKNSTNKYGSILDIQKITGRPNIGASTTFYNWNEQGLNISKNNWDWSKIEVTNVYHSKNDKTKRGIMVHEIGHALGLNHNDSNPKGGTVMWKNYKSSMANGPTLNDFKGINKLYK